MPETIPPPRLRWYFDGYGLRPSFEPPHKMIVECAYGPNPYPVPTLTPFEALTVSKSLGSLQFAVELATKGLVALAVMHAEEFREQMLTLDDWMTPDRGSAEPGRKDRAP
jgi:hypothetical protein